MVIGKLKYQIGPASGTISHPLGRSRFIFLSGRTGAETSGSVVGEGDPDPRTGKKGEKLRGRKRRRSPCVCVRFPWPG